MKKTDEKISKKEEKTVLRPAFASEPHARTCEFKVVMETTDSTQDLRRKVKNPGCKLAQVRVQRPISAGNFKWFGYYQLDYIVASSPNVNLPLVLVFCI